MDSKFQNSPSDYVQSVPARHSFKSTVSVVIPIYNELELLPELGNRLMKVIESQPDYAWEVIMVNDGSQDGSAMVLSKLSDQYPWLSVLHLSRNFGHQIAISAGIDFATGDAVIVMDGDLQDPPELLPSMLDRWLSGFDVVYATRRSREGETPFKLFTAKLFYQMLKGFSDIDIPVDTGDFRLMSRPVVNALSLMREKNRFVRGMVSWVGFSQSAIYYERDPRVEGETKYTLFKMIRFAIDGMLSFSTVPLQWITTFGFIVSAVSFVGILVIIVMAFLPDLTVPGWSSMMVVILLMGGIQLIGMGMVGEYVGRIFDEVRNRPLYLISKIDSQRYGYLSQTKQPEIRETAFHNHNANHLPKNYRNL